jgi:hypothetical protein
MTVQTANVLLRSGWVKQDLKKVLDSPLDPNVNHDKPRCPAECAFLRVTVHEGKQIIGGSNLPQKRQCPKVSLPLTPETKPHQTLQPPGDSDREWGLPFYFQIPWPDNPRFPVEVHDIMRQLMGNGEYLFAR